MLRFQTLASDVSPGFWTLAGDRKLEEWQLDETPVVRNVYYEIRGYLHTARPPQQPARLSVGVDAFSSFQHEQRRSPIASAGEAGNADSVFSMSVPVTGVFRNVGSRKAFKEIDKQSLLDDAGGRVIAAVDNGDTDTDPSTLFPFVLLSFMDLKTYKHIYWTAFPALSPVEGVTASPPRFLERTWSADTVHRVNCGLEHLARGTGHIPILFGVSKSCLVGGSGDLVVPWHELVNSLRGGDADDWIVGVLDLSHRDGLPGWLLRNTTVFLGRRALCDRRRVDVLCYRPGPHGSIQSGEAEGETEPEPTAASSFLLTVDVPECFRASEAGWQVVGWEHNRRGALAPRRMDLSSLMHSDKQLERALGLNLNLMRWRMLPSLQIETLKKQRCLLIGAGTLGCYVARSLLGWGVQHITFVDSCRVSLSNPVRQPLFEVKDSEKGGKPKAEAAADAIRRIAPHVDSRGVSLMVPMPGHAAGSDEARRAQQEAVAELDQLIQDHDVIYLLTDSRESRWLPTVMAACHKKPAMNVALGFDSFLVMRHGLGDDDSPSRLGCYFCSDVVAPEDSLSDRTLDQMCTVTRAGLAPTAAAWGVELMVTMLHHPEGWEAGHEEAPELSSATTTALGVAPHQVRFFQKFFRPLLLGARRFTHCTACSTPVLEAYRERGYGLVEDVGRDPRAAEELSGLAEMKRSMEQASTAAAATGAGDDGEDEWEDLAL